MKTVKIGIDLGTTNSLIGKFEGERVQIFKNPVGFRDTLPSVVAFRPERTLIGDKAKEFLTKDPVNVFSSFKRKMGTEEKFYVTNIDQNITPIELSSMILKELCKFVKDEDVSAAVITIPASFDSMQSAATIKAAHLAGIKHPFLLQEPIAASLAFFNETKVDDLEGKHWLVYDFGGGTFDVALVKADESSLKIVDHQGNNFLGGIDLDNLMLKELIIPQLEKITGLSIMENVFDNNNRQYEKMYFILAYLAEEAKKELSQAEETSIDTELELNGQMYDVSIAITRSQLDTIFRDKIDETIHLTKLVMENNRLSVLDISALILVGGSTYLPQVKSQLTEQLGIPINHKIDPTTAVAVGAAYYAANKTYLATDEPKPTNDEIDDEDLKALLVDELALPAEPSIEIEYSYNKTSRDNEEVLIMRVIGPYEGHSYRIIRKDGGYDSGISNLKSKVTEFLPLLSSFNNIFECQIYDPSGKEISHMSKHFDILHGKFAIEGQPLPHDICLEVDDLENSTTKLSAIFERNALLPLKRTLYREASKTITKGSKETILINILEGDQYSRPTSNTNIGFLEIEGSKLTSDIIKGSDIEIEFHIDESRVLTVNIYIVMTQQEFKSVFNLSEKKINISRLKEQFTTLENDLFKSLRDFKMREDDIMVMKIEYFLKELRNIKSELLSLKDSDRSDRKYIFAEKLSQISKESDKMGGNETIALLIEEYLKLKDNVWVNIQAADFEKDSLVTQFKKIETTEESFMKSKNVSIINAKIDALENLDLNARMNSIGTLMYYFTILKDRVTNSPNRKEMEYVIKVAEQAKEKENYAEFRKNVHYMLNLAFGSSSPQQQMPDFKGTGIG